MSASKPGLHSFNLPSGVVALLPQRSRALWKVSAVEDFLGCDRDAVLRRIEDGRIAWCFVLSKREQKFDDLRCLLASVLECAGRPTGLPKRTADMTFTEVMQLIWPYNRDPRGVELQKLFGCHPVTIRGLSERGALRISNRAQAKSGPYASHRYSKDSLVRFLEKGRFS